jgi:hypothetical protein
VNYDRWFPRIQATGKPFLDREKGRYATPSLRPPGLRKIRETKGIWAAFRTREAALKAPFATYFARPFSEMAMFSICTLPGVRVSVDFRSGRPRKTVATKVFAPGAGLPQHDSRQRFGPRGTQINEQDRRSNDQNSHEPASRSGECRRHCTNREGCQVFTRRGMFSHEPPALCRRSCNWTLSGTERPRLNCARRRVTDEILRLLAQSARLAPLCQTFDSRRRSIYYICSHAGKTSSAGGQARGRTQYFRIRERQVYWRAYDC